MQHIAILYLHAVWKNSGLPWLLFPGPKGFNDVEMELSVRKSLAEPASLEIAVMATTSSSRPCLASVASNGSRHSSCASIHTTLGTLSSLGHFFLLNRESRHSKTNPSPS